MLYMDIDYQQIVDLQDELGATEKQVQMAYGRAINRTAKSLRRIASKGLVSELGLRNAKELRRRLKTLRLKKTSTLDEVKIWFGANDMAVSSFKGTPTKTRTGASFRGHDFPGGFVAKVGNGKRSIFKRSKEARLPIHEETLPVSDQMQTYIEDEVFTDENLGSIFFKHFSSDLRARVIYGVGRK